MLPRYKAPGPSIPLLEVTVKACSRYFVVLQSRLGCEVKGAHRWHRCSAHVCIVMSAKVSQLLWKAECQTSNQTDVPPVRRATGSVSKASDPGLPGTYAPTTHCPQETSGHLPVVPWSRPSGTGLPAIHLPMGRAVMTATPPLPSSNSRIASREAMTHPPGASQRLRQP